MRRLLRAARPAHEGPIQREGDPEKTRDTTTRRSLLKAGTGAAIGAGGLLGAPAIQAQATWNNQPEKGSKLRVLRWSRFVQGDIDAYMVNVWKFTERTGIEVRVDNEGWEDVRPKAAVAANVGSGPDIILSTSDDANLYPDKLVDVTDLCDYLGKKSGGWYPAAEADLRPDGKKWIGVPLGNATGDSGWTHWLMWAFGGSIVDRNNKVVIDSPETIRALE